MGASMEESTDLARHAVERLLIAVWPALNVSPGAGWSHVHLVNSGRKGFPPHHCGIRLRSVHVLNMSSRGASRMCVDELLPHQRCSICENVNGPRFRNRPTTASGDDELPGCA
jgi:hypothetical protein